MSNVISSMSSVVQRSLKKETSTLGEIVSLNYIKSNKNVIGLRKLKAQDMPSPAQCMSTRSSSSSNLVPPSSDPESILRNRRRNLGDPSLLLDFEEINMANNNNNQGPPPAGPNILAPDLRPMEELL
ncbi:hypothetical protein Tco_0848592 [Tanacetum coccineum]